MKTASEIQALHESLARFQELIQQQVPSDQLQSWNRQTNRAFDDLQQHVDRCREYVHETLYETIAADGSGNQRSRITDFEETDARIQEFCELIKAHIAAFAVGDSDVVEEDDPNITQTQLQRLEEQRLEFVDLGQQLVEWIRKHEQFVMAWFAEAYVEKVQQPHLG